MIIKLVCEENGVSNHGVGMWIAPAENKRVKEDMKEMYAQKLVEAIKAEQSPFFFYSEGIPEHKKVAKLTSEALREMLFDVSWYCSDNGLDDSNFQVVIVVPDDETEKFYRKSLKQMGIEV